jgi:NADPH:quinone reductase-like Zn-dependent oxidoreductase
MGLKMKAIQLKRFGSENLALVELDKPRPGPGEVLLKFGAASINSRDLQIISGQFSPDQPLPIIPVSDGAGEVVEVGEAVDGLVVGDRVCPLFFPEWASGEALTDQRKLSSGLEVPGVLREFGVYAEHQVVKTADHLTAAEAACLPCAGLTAWTSLVTLARIRAGDWVLVLGTGGVSLFGLQFAKSLGANVIVTSGSDEKLARAIELGADAGINYRDDKNWGSSAKDLSGGGVHAVLEIGGTNTLPQSVAALRRGGHIAIIGYLAGIDIGLTVFDLIERNAHLHGISVGNREGFEEMMACIDEHGIHPVIAKRFALADTAKAIAATAEGECFGKVVVDIND